MDSNQSGSGRTGESENVCEQGPLENLEQRSVQGGFWIVLLQGVNRLLQLVRMVILAKLLAPDDFGMFGVALISLSVLTVISQTGFSFALIHKQKNPFPYLDTIWTVGVIRGITVAGILFFLAPLIERFFEISGTTELVQVIGFSFALSTLVNSAVIMFEKELDYGRFFWYQGSVNIVGVTVAIVCAFWWRNAWALVAGALASDMTRVIASYCIHPYRPSFRIDREKIRELFEFGKWMTGTFIMYFIGRNGVDVLVGKLLGAAELGLYQLSYRVAFIPSTELAGVANRVSFPTLALLQDQDRRYRKAFFRTIRMVMVCVLPAAGITFCLAPDLIGLFLDSRWYPTRDLVIILALVAPFQAVSFAGEALFSSFGTPQYTFFSWLIRNMMLLAVSIPLIVYFGIIGAGWAIGIDALVGFFLWMLFSGRVLVNPWRDFWNNLAPSMITLVLVLIPWLVIRITTGTDGWSVGERLAFLGLGGVWLLGGYLLGLRFIRLLFHDFDIFGEFSQIYRSVRLKSSS